MQYFRIHSTSIGTGQDDLAPGVGWLQLFDEHLDQIALRVELHRAGWTEDFQHRVLFDLGLEIFAQSQHRELHGVAYPAECDFAHIELADRRHDARQALAIGWEMDR